MFREISTKSGIFSKRREILHFFREICCALSSARGAVGAFGASIRALVWRALCCGTRLTRLCSRLRRLDLSRTTFQNFPAPLRASSEIRPHSCNFEKQARFWGSPSPKGAQSPQFVAHICCGQMIACIKMSLDVELGLGPGDVVLDGDPAPPSQKGGGAPKFSAHVYCGQTAGWMKLILGVEVGLSPGDFVLDGNPAPPPKKEAEPGGGPQFSAHVYCVQTAGWINMALGMEVGLGPVRIVLDGDTAALRKKGADPPNFPPIFIVAKRLDASRCHLVWR